MADDAPIYVTQADLEARFPALDVARMFSDNGADRVGPRLATSCSVGCRQADAVLLKAWTAGGGTPPETDQLEALVLGDDAVLDAVCDLVMAHGGKGKAVWKVYSDLAAAAIATLERYAIGQKRSRAEATAGANPNIRGRRTVPCPQFVFAPSRRNPKPGGY